jgi:CO/xanthine dehydrogenase Mo-binding subunit
MNDIGIPRRRVDGRAKVTGQTRFADDVMLPRMLHCKLLRSTLPHARIVRIDASRAQAHPGVHLVLTGADFPIPYGILPVSQDEHALATDKVRFVGDPVAAVIARDELTAFEALDLIDVEYEPLRTFATPEDSLTHEEPRIHEYGDVGNIHKAVSLGLAMSRRALAAADHVSEDTFFYEGNTHLPIEQHAAAPRRPPTASSCCGRHADAALRPPRRWPSPCPLPTSASSPRRTAAASAARAIRSITKWLSRRRHCCSIAR